MTRSRLLPTLIMLGTIAGVQGQAADPIVIPRHGGEIRVAIRSDPPSTIPGVNRNSISDDILHHVVEGLVEYREDFTIAPQVAQSFDISPDLRSYTFHLRPGLLFQNEAPVTSREVRWTWQWLMDEKTHWLCRNWYDGSIGLKVERVETPDPLTVRFDLQQPNALFLKRLANIQCILPVLHPDSLDASGQWRAPVATGPYKLKEWKRGQYLLLERFARYRPVTEPRSGLAGARIADADRIRWMVIPEPAAAIAALQAGQVHLLYGINALDARRLEGTPGIQLHRAVSLGRNVLLMQTDAPPLRDIRVRLAIAHAIDYDKLAQAVSWGLTKPNPSVIAQSSEYHSAVQSEGYRFDPALSRRLLAQSGYHGSPIKLQTNKRMPNMYDSALIIQSMLRAVGIDAQLEVLEWTTQLNNYYARKFELMAFAFSGRTDPVFEFETILGDRAANGFVQWGNPAARALIARAGLILEPRERQPLFDLAHRLMIADVPGLNLCNQYVIDATSSALEGYKAWAAGTPRLWGVRLKR